MNTILHTENDTIYVHFFKTENEVEYCFWIQTLTGNKKYKNMCDEKRKKNGCDGYTTISKQWLPLGREDGKEMDFSGGGEGFKY